MTRTSARLVLASLFALGLGVSPSQAVHISKTATTDGLRIELHVMPAEPFYTADQVESNTDLEGMLIVGGAKPLPLDAQPHPNCHLIVHVFDAQTGKALTDADVSMEYQLIDEHGKLQETAVQVPVVIMQVIGKGPETTHYGNNVVLPDGAYIVTVVANGKKAAFYIDLSSKEEDSSDKKAQKER
jgi:hypothetical protein